MNLETLILELTADTSKLNQAIDKSVAEATKRIQSLEKNIVSPSVDFNKLHKLNQLLDVKQRHIKETARVFRQNPLIPHVDTSKVRQADADVQKFKRTLSDVNGTTINGKQTFKIEHEHHVNVRESNKAIADSISELSAKLDNRSALNEIARSTRRQADNTRNIDKKTKKEGLLSNVRKGLAAGVGQNLTQPFSEGFLSKFQESSGVDLQATGKFLGSALGKTEKFIVDNIRKSASKFGQLAGVKEAGQELGEKLGDILSDSVIVALDKSTTFSELASNLSETLSDNLGDLSDSIEKAGQKLLDINNFIEAVGAKPEKGKSMLQTPLARSIGVAVAPVLQQGIAARRSVLPTKSIPLVLDRAQEIIDKNSDKQGKISSSKIQSLIGKNQTDRLKVLLGTDSPQVITPETQELFITIGGYAGHKQAASGLRIAGDIVGQAYGEGRSDVAAIGVKNPDTDINPSMMADPQQKMLGLLGSLAKPNVRGYSKDAVEIAAQAVAAIMTNPNIQVKIVGESGGGYAAEEAVSILETMGYGANVSGAGFGTPNFIGGVTADNFNKFLGKDRAETLGYEAHQVYAPLGMADVSAAGQNIEGLTGHPIEHYQSTAEYQKFVHGKTIPKKTASSKAGNADILAVESYLQELISSPSVAAETVKDNLVAILSKLASIEADDSVQGLVSSLEDQILEILDQDELIDSLSNYKKALAQAEAVIPNAMMTAETGGIDTLKVVAKEIATIQIDIQRKKQSAKGILAKELDVLSEQLKVHQSTIGNLAKDPKSFKFDYIKSVASPQIDDASQSQDVFRLLAIKDDLNKYIKDITDDADFNLSTDGTSVKKELILLKKKVIDSIKTISTQSEPVITATPEVAIANNDDPWGFDVKTTLKTAKEKVSQAVKNITGGDTQSLDIDPFSNAKFAKTQTTQSINADEKIYKELVAIHNWLKSQGKATNTSKQTTDPGVDVVYGELMNEDITAGLALSSTQETNALKSALTGGAKMLQTGYSILKGVEDFVFDSAAIMSGGLIQGKAVKSVTQKIAPAAALGMLGHDVPMIGAAMDLAASNIITPLMQGGLGAAGSGIAGLLPEGLVTGAATLGGWLGHIPGAGAVSGGLAELGGTAMGGAGTALTYLLGGNAVRKGGQFALNQAVKPLGLLPPVNKAAEDAAYNALSGTANVVGGVYNGVQKLKGSKPVPLQLPQAQLRQPELVTIMEPPLLQTRSMNVAALPPTTIDVNSTAVNDNVNSQLLSLKATLERTVENDSAAGVDDAINRIESISATFKKFYADLEKSLSAGNLKLAKSQAKVIKSVEIKAKNDLDEMSNELSKAGINTALGTSGVGNRLRGLKGNLTKWSKGADKTLNTINQKESNAAYLDVPALSEQVRTAGGQQPDLDLAQKAVHKLLAVFDQLEGLDLNSVGRNTLKGLQKGLLDESGGLDKDVAAIAQSLPDNVKKVLGIKSPSRVFIEIGQNIMAGLSMGIKNSISEVEQAINEILEFVGAVEPEEIEIAVPVINLPEIPLPGAIWTQDLTDKVNSAMESAMQDISLPDPWETAQLSPIPSNPFSPIEYDNSMWDDAMESMPDPWESAQSLSIPPNPFSPIEYDDSIWDDIAESAQESAAIVGQSTDEITGLLEELCDAIPSIVLDVDIASPVAEIEDLIDDIVDTADDTENTEVAPNLFDALRANIPILDQFIGGFENAYDSVKRFGLAVAGGLGLVVLGKMLYDVAASSVNVYREFEGIFIASKMVSGGSEYIGKLREQVGKLGGDLQATTREGIQFAAALQGTSLEASAQDLFLSADQSLKSFGLNTQQYESAILALKQVASKGKVSMEEISGQLGEAVPGALNIAAKAMGTNVQGLIQQIESGNVLSEDFVPKFIKQLEAQTAFLEPAIKESLNVQMDKLSANTTQVQVEIGAKIAPNLAAVTEQVANAMGFVADNIDDVIKGVTVLAIALALPVGQLALDHLVKLFWKMAAAVNGASLSVATLQVAFSGLMAVAGKLLVAFAAFEVINFAFAAFNNYSSELQSGLKETDAVLKGLIKTSDELGKSIGKLNQPTTNNFGMNFADAVNRFFMGDNANTWAGERVTNNKEMLNKMFNDTQQYLNKTSKVFNQSATNDYINQAKALDQQIKGKRAQAAALNIKDPVGNQEQIATLRKEADEMAKVLSGLDDQFTPGGILGIEQMIQEMEKIRKETENLQTKYGGDYSAQLSEIDRIIADLNKRLSANRGIQEDITNGVNRQREAYIQLNAQVIRNRENLALVVAQRKEELLLQQASGQLGDKTANQLTLNQDLAAQEGELSVAIAERNGILDYLATQLAPGSRETVESLIGKSMFEADLGDISAIQNYLKTGGKDIKDAMTDQIVGELEKLAQSTGNIQNIKTAIAQVRVSQMQAERDLIDFYRDLNRQIEDFYLDQIDQQIQVNTQSEGFRRQLEDAQISAVRENRQLVESYNDLILDIETQLLTAQNALKDTQAQIQSVQFDQFTLELTPGVSNSAARRVAGIFKTLFDGLAGNETESRNLKVEATQIQREYTNTLRRIRDLQEQQLDAERNRLRTIVDLRNAEIQMAMSVFRMMRDFGRRIDDMNLSTTRALGTQQAAPYLVGGSLNAPAPVRAPQANLGQSVTRPPAANNIVSTNLGKKPTIELKLASSDEVLLQKLILAEAGGESFQGKVAVARSVFNRQYLLSTGKAPLGSAGYGAKSANLRDIIYAPNQYEPVRNGGLNKNFSQAQMNEAARAAQVAQSPDQMRQMGIPESVINSTNFQASRLGKQRHWNYSTRYGNHNFGGDKFTDKLNQRSSTSGLNFDITGMENVLGETAGPLDWMRGFIPDSVKKKVPQQIKDAFNSTNKALEEMGESVDRVIKDPGGVINRKLDLGKTIGQPSSKWTFTGLRETVANWYLRQIGARLGKTQEQIDKAITIDMVKLLAGGQKLGKVKIFGQSIPQQAFEDMVKMGDGNATYISPNDPRYQKRKAQSTTQSKPQAVAKSTPKPKSPPKASVPTPKSLPTPQAPPSPANSPVYSFGSSPMVDQTFADIPMPPSFTMQSELAGNYAFDLLQTQQENLGQKQILTEERANLLQMQAVDNLKSELLGLEDATRSTNRELRESQRNVLSLGNSSKGYLTIQEEITNAVLETTKSYESSIEAAEDRVRQLVRESESMDVLQAELNLELETNQALTAEQKEQLSVQISAIAGKVEANKLAADDFEVVGQTLKLDKQRAEAARMAFESREAEYRLLQMQSGMAANYADVMFRAGNTGMINQSGVMKAQLDAQLALKQAEDDVAKSDGRLGQDYITMAKTIGELNIQEAIANSIPGLNEFTSGLGEVIKGTKSWQDALKGVVDAIAEVALQTLVLAPLKNMLAGMFGGLTGLGGATATQSGGGGFLGNIFGFLGGLFADGGMVPNYAMGGSIDSAYNKEMALTGKQPHLIMAHEGEQVLSTLNGDAQLWRALETSGRWDELKATPINNYAMGGTVGGAEPMTRSYGRSGGGVTVVQNWNVTTNDADSFKRSQRQIDTEAAARYRRAMR